MVPPPKKNKTARFLTNWKSYHISFYHHLVVSLCLKKFKFKSSSFIRKWFLPYILKKTDNTNTIYWNICTKIDTRCLKNVFPGQPKGETAHFLRDWQGLYSKVLGHGEVYFWKITLFGEHPVLLQGKVDPGGRVCQGREARWIHQGNITYMIQGVHNIFLISYCMCKCCLISFNRIIVM